ncbi:ABC transporter permease [Pseudomonas sp. XS1P51]
MNIIPVIFIAATLVVAVYTVAALIERRRDPHPPAHFFRRNGWVMGVAILLLVVIWALFSIVLPQFFMIDLSFHHMLPPSQVGGPRDVYTLENYRYFLFGSTVSTAEWNDIHLRAYGVTIVASIAITLLNLALCYPLAFYMAQSASLTTSRIRLFFLLLITPYWVNDLLRAFAIRILLSDQGVFNQMLMGLGIISSPVDFIGANVGLYMGLSYAYLLLMIFPLYNAIESLDRNQIEAARDLGAPWWHIHWFVVIPHAKPGIASGCTLVFMLCSGALAAPLVLSGPRTLWFTPIVYDRFYQAFNWPQGAAYAFILLAGCIVFVLAVLRLTQLKLGEVAK